MHKGNYGMMRLLIIIIIRKQNPMRDALVFLGVLAGMVALVMMWSGGDRALVKVYDRAVTADPPRCLTLQIYPSDGPIASALRRAYRFDPSCPYRLEVSGKSNIHCTSNQNSDRKALSAFPSSFLRMEIRRGMRLLYSYYIDLTRPAGADDALRAFDRIRQDLRLP